MLKGFFSDINREDKTKLVTFLNKLLERAKTDVTYRKKLLKEQKIHFNNISNTGDLEDIEIKFIEAKDPGIEIMGGEILMKLPELQKMDDDSMRTISGGIAGTFQMKDSKLTGDIESKGDLDIKFTPANKLISIEFSDKE